MEPSVVKDHVSEIKDAFSVIVKTLSDAAGQADGPPRLFFPNGIELLKVEFSVGQTSVLTVNVTVAGKDGVPGAGKEKQSDLGVEPANERID